MTKAAAAMVVPRDEWVTAAMRDDDIVVELLLRLKQARSTTAENPLVLSTLRWGVHRPRTRSSRFGSSGGGSSINKVVDSARASPTTPLSWSGGYGSCGGSASPSAATADGFEETILQGTCSTSAGSRSKAGPANDITSAFSKRSKRKKTFSELKDEENSLLKQRTNLEKEIATLRATFKEQSARNENLKRIKLDFNSDYVKNVIPDDPDREKYDQALPSSSSSDPIILQKREASLIKGRLNSESCTIGDEAPGSADGGFFLLPDLNMTPSEEDWLSETLYCTS